jgi:hypothetical protein
MAHADAGQDPVMARITAAIALSHGGAPGEAAPLFDALWAEIGADGDPFHRCALAHYAADVQDDPRVELMWDERALAAADETPAGRAAEYQASLQVRTLYPLLHLNLADVHRRLGDPSRARAHAARARERLPVLDGTEASAPGHAETVIAALDRVEARLSAEEDGAPVSTP